jgi:hypothetical protein
MRTKVFFASLTVAAMSTNQMALRTYTVSHFQRLHIPAHFDNLANKLMADYQGQFKRPPCPIVPLINMQVGAADGSFADFDQDIIIPDSRDRNLFKP